jgi:streptogramin lyase
MPGEVNTLDNDETWYTDMASAIKARDKAVAMIERWETAKAEAEAEIETLRISQQQQLNEPAPATEE